MSAAALLDQLERRDIRISVRGDLLHVDAPVGELTAAERAMLVANRSSIIRTLAAADPEVAWRVEAMRPQVPVFPGIIPVLKVRGDTAPGTCLSCGEDTDQPRCNACIAAIKVVLDGWAG